MEYFALSCLQVIWHNVAYRTTSGTSRLQLTELSCYLGYSCYFRLVGALSGQFITPLTLIFKLLPYFHWLQSCSMLLIQKLPLLFDSPKLLLAVNNSHKT